MISTGRLVDVAVMRFFVAALIGAGCQLGGSLLYFELHCYLPFKLLLMYGSVLGGEGGRMP